MVDRAFVLVSIFGISELSASKGMLSCADGKLQNFQGF